ncbi:hypothetical protein DFP72DRAFT_851360 [Ephemerocybe angulata]|uniref:Uncharacterized protein n=1 Tax=Ephemerocybe angulata TaxID=980116 RepID=A0A8H6M3H1_9AGAR|nr:hypothetical protein DFP72DRAFT_851360 [Tulosesus angulatus]
MIETREQRVLKLGSIPDLTKEQWTGVLKLSRLWIIVEATAVTIEKLSSLGLTSTEKIKLRKTHRVLKRRDIQALYLSDISMGSKDKMVPLGWETIYNILWTSNQVSNLQTACGACGRIPAKSGYGITIPDPAALSIAIGDRFKLVAEEVAEVFKENLEDAEFHNNAAVPKEGHA